MSVPSGIENVLVSGLENRKQTLVSLDYVESWNADLFAVFVSVLLLISTSSLAYRCL